MKTTVDDRIRRAISRRKLWVVIDNERKTRNGRLLTLRRFFTEREASEWIGQRPDKAKVERGGYGLDGPAE
jgi:hypothetical protein